MECQGLCDKRTLAHPFLPQVHVTRAPRGLMGAQRGLTGAPRGAETRTLPGAGSPARPRPPGQDRPTRIRDKNTLRVGAALRPRPPGQDPCVTNPAPASISGDPTKCLEWMAGTRARPALSSVEIFYAFFLPRAPGRPGKTGREPCRGRREPGKSRRGQSPPLR